MKLLKKHKNWIALAAVLSITSGGLAGCQSSSVPSEESTSKTDAASSGTEEKAMGRYLEESLPVPEGATNVSDIKFLDSGKLRILYNDKDFLLCQADSEDNGKTWTKGVSLLSILGKDASSESITCASIAKDGSIFAAARPLADGMDTDNVSFKFYSISPDGTAKELSSDAHTPGSYIFNCAFTDKNTVLLNNTGDGVKEIDPADGSLLNQYETGTRVDYFGTAGKYLMTMQDGSPHYYDLETGKPLDNMEPLTEQIKSDPDNLFLSNSSALPVLFAQSPEKDTLFYADRNGLYSYTPGNTSVEKLIDGTLNSLSSPVSGFTAMVQDKEGSFYLSVIDGSSSSGSEGRIYKYTYDKNTATVPDTELTIYSLRESSLLKQAAIVFQKENPDVFLNIETGISGEDSVTTTDALKILNTEIMADKGPDLLLMDGIPTDTYTEKGMLEDISGLFKDLPVLENIKSAYTKEDGSIYAFPVKFGIPLIEGKKEDVDKISDLKTLADAAVSHEGEYKMSAFFTAHGVSPELLLKALTDVNMPAWLNEDGTLNEEAVTEFFREANRIYQPTKAIVEEMLAQYGETETDFASEYNRHEFGVAGSALNVMGGQEKVGLGGLYSPTDLAYLDSVNTKDDSFTLRLWDGQSKNNFYPEQLIAVNAKASEKEAAIKFVQFLFSEEGQKIGSETGFPVLAPLYESLDYWNAGSDEAISYTSSGNPETGETLELEVYPPSVETTEQIISLGKTLTVPAEDNTIIQNAVMEAGAKYLKGDASLEEAVKAAMQEVNLYLSE